MIFATVPYPQAAARGAGADAAAGCPGRLKPFAALKPPWRSSERPPTVTPAEGERRGAGRAAARLRPARRLRRRERRDRAGAGRRGLRGRRAATASSAAARCTSTRAGPRRGARRARAARRGLRRRGRDRRQRRRLRVTPEGGGARRPGRRRQRAARRARPRARSGAGCRCGSPTRTPATSAHAQGIRDAPRSLLRTIPGLELVEPAEQAICCGSAGIYNLVQPAAAAELGQRKAANVVRTGARRTSAPTRAASSRSRTTSAGRAGGYPPCIRSSCSTRRSRASPPAGCSPERVANGCPRAAP